MLFGALQAQNLNYYSGTYTQTGTALKTSLHDLIDDHTELEYGTIKTIIRQADIDPANSNNIILMYTGNSINKWDFANNPSDPTMYDFWNREHTWPKSHGDFGPDGIYTEKGANTDAHHLRPVDMTMNSARSYKDFDNGGTVVNNGSTPTDCKTTNNTWEPRDAVKGDVARMMFYMATRYEGGNSLAGDAEPDLELVEAINTFPNPQLGRLSTLLQWHLNDPVDARELFRNDVIENWQGNRNPFIDYPEYAQMVFGTGTALAGSFSNLALSPAAPTQGDLITVSVEFAGGNPGGLTLYWGNDWNTVLDETNSVSMTNTTGNTYTAQIPSQVYSAKVKFRIKNGGSNGNYISHNFQIEPEPFTGTITPITTVQGTGAHSPMAWQITDASGTQTNPANDVEISVTGIVTGAFGNNFFIQESTELRSGMYIYNSSTFPSIGDSVIVTGKVKEYFNMTEIVNISNVHIISSNNQLPEATVVSTGDIKTSSPNAEDYESMLVKVLNAEHTSVPTPVAYGMWRVDDGSGECLIHNSSVFTYNPTIGEYYDVSGILNFNFDEFKVELRFTEDVQSAVDLIGPKIVKSTYPAPGYLHVWFNEEVEKTSMEDKANYSINNGVVIGDITQDVLNNRKAIFHIWNVPQGTHILTADGCKDVSGNIGNDTTSFYNGTSSVSVEENEFNGVSAFVNNHSLIISNVNSSAVQVEILNTLGQSITQESFVGEKEIALPSGMYIIRFTSNGKQLIRKVQL